MSEGRSPERLRRVAARGRDLMAKPLCATALIALGVVAIAGASASEPSPRIVGGGKANAAGWQFAVAIEQKRRLICSGSLIGPTEVLTAAHCAKGGKRKQLSVLAGSPSISPKRRLPRIKVTGVVVDPTYNGRKVERDFAVLTLASPPEAQPIALPTRAEAKAATRPGRIVRTAGFGTRSAWGFNVARRLKATKEIVFAPRVCDRLFGKERGFQQATMICALGKRVRRFHSRLPYYSTSCTGDSGGPVVANTHAGARLVGVVSAGPFPCGLGAPSLYARVSSRIGFIRQAARLPGR
jgi:secreted trypsin-like serine protease